MHSFGHTLSLLPVFKIALLHMLQTVPNTSMHLTAVKLRCFCQVFSLAANVMVRLGCASGTLVGDSVSTFATLLQIGPMSADTCVKWLQLV